MQENGESRINKKMHFLDTFLMYNHTSKPHTLLAVDKVQYKFLLLVAKRTVCN